MLNLNWPKRYTRAIVVLGLMTAVGSAIGCGSLLGSAESGDTSSDDAARTQRFEGFENFSIGETAIVGELAITVNGIRATDGRDDKFSWPLANNYQVYYLVDVTIDNLGDTSEVIAPRMQMSLFDAKGETQEWAVFVATNGSIDGKVTPDVNRNGELAWEVPKDAKGMRMTFKQVAFTLGDVGDVWVERTERLSARR